MTEAEEDQYLSMQFAWACLRVEMQAGRKLSPEEMIRLVDEESPREG